MKYYYFFGRIARPFLGVGFHLFCVLTKTPRVRIVARNENNEILLVKSWMSVDEWSFPGGGVDRGESPSAAACRELREETGIIAKESQMEPLGSIYTWGHDEILFSLQIPGNRLTGDLPSRFEIQEAAWFADEAIPKLGSLAQQVITKVATNR